MNWSIKFFAILFLEQMISFSYRCVIRAGNSATGKRQSCSAETHHGDHGGSTHQSSVKCQDSKFTECIKIYEPHPQPTWYTVLQMTPCLCYFFMVYLWLLFLYGHNKLIVVGALTTEPSVYESTHLCRQPHYRHCSLEWNIQFCISWIYAPSSYLSHEGHFVWNLICPFW